MLQKGGPEEAGTAHRLTQSGPAACGSWQATAHRVPAPAPLSLQAFPYLQRDMKKSQNREIGELFDAGGWPEQSCAVSL